MATSSITKEFKVKDEKAFQKMMNDIGNKPDRTVSNKKPSSLERGADLLKRFSFR